MGHILLVYNPNSGSFLDMAEAEITSYLQRRIQKGGGPMVRLLSFGRHDLADIRACIESRRPDAVWVAGGDGTVRSVAQIAADTDVPIGVLPGGTVNLLARDLGMATDLDTAIDQLRHAREMTIDAAEYNGNFFLCITNLGFSTRLTEYREKFRQYPAWVRWPLLGWQALNFLFAYPVMTIELEVEGRTHRLYTRSISISNNPLAEDSRLIPARPALDRRTLGIYASRDTSPLTLPRLALRWLVGNWPQDEDLLVFEAPRATIRCRPRRRMRVMCDGELDRLAPPLAFRINPGHLRVLAPKGDA